MPIECEFRKNFEWNGKFKVVSGKRHFKNGVLEFPKEDESWLGYAHDGWIRTLYGWRFAHSGVIYKNSNGNLSRALERLTCKRGLPDQNADLKLKNDQRILIGAISGDFKKLFLKSYGRIYWEDDMFEDARIMTLIPHMKRRLRVECHKDIYDSGDVGKPVWTFGGTMTLKMKVGEYAKPPSEKKYPRVICDLGCPNSLMAGMYAKRLKAFVAENEFLIHNTSVSFISTPDPKVVARSFELLRDSSTKRTMIIFSDDSCISIRKDGVVKFFNMDISSCDSSHTEALLNLMFDCSYAPVEIMAAIRAQAFSNARIKSVDNKYSCTLRVLEFYLQSGISITTILNNFAQFLIAYALEMADAIDSAGVIAAAANAGYIVTLEECNKIEDLQFLKMSPTFNTDGELTASLNLGVILRASGNCKHELPGQGSWVDRATQQQTALMTGLFSGIDYPPLEKLNPGVPITGVTDIRGISGALDRMLEVEGMVKEKYLRSDIYRRYDLSDWEIDELEEYIALSEFGTTVYCSAATKILQKDYGLGLDLL